MRSLDLLLAVCLAYDRARAVFGESTGAWFTTAHQGLEGLSSLGLLRTRFGERRLNSFIDAMLDRAAL